MAGLMLGVLAQCATHRIEQVGRIIESTLGGADQRGALGEGLLDRVIAPGPDQVVGEQDLTRDPVGEGLAFALLALRPTGADP